MISLKIPRGRIYQNYSILFKGLVSVFFKNKQNHHTLSAFKASINKTFGTNNCLLLPLARTAVFLTLKSLNLPKNSEVIMPPITIKPMLDVALELGLKPVFVDIDKKNLNFEIQDLKNKISQNTRAVLLTHLWGISADLNEIVGIFKKNKIFIIEDFSHNFNSIINNVKAGLIGDVGICSLSTIKTIDTFGGAILISKNENIIEKINLEKIKNLTESSRIIIFQKIVKNIILSVSTEKHFFSNFIFYILKLIKSITKSKTKMLGNRNKNRLKKIPKSWLCSYSSIQAEVGIKKLKQVEKEDNSRIEFAEKIQSILIKKNIKFPCGDKPGKDVFWQFLFYPENPVAFERKMMKLGVDCTSTSLEYLPKLSYVNYTKLPNAEFVYENGIFIPCHSNFSDKEKDFILEKLYKAL